MRKIKAAKRPRYVRLDSQVGKSNRAKMSSNQSIRTGTPARTEDAPHSLLKCAFPGAVSGFLAWLFYGTVEFTLAVTVPRLWSTKSKLQPWQWPLLGMLFTVYAAAGPLFGAAGRAWLARKGRVLSPAEHRTVACLVLPPAFAANLAVAWALPRSEMVALVMAAALAVVLFAALGSETWRGRLAFLTSPAILPAAADRPVGQPESIRQQFRIRENWGVVARDWRRSGFCFGAAPHFSKEPLSRAFKASAVAVMVALFLTATLGPLTHQHRPRCFTRGVFPGAEAEYPADHHGHVYGRITSRYTDTNAAGLCSNV